MNSNSIVNTHIFSCSTINETDVFPTGQRLFAKGVQRRTIQLREYCARKQGLYSLSFVTEKIHKKRKKIRANSTKGKKRKKRIGKMLKKWYLYAMLRLSYLGRERRQICSFFDFIFCYKYYERGVKSGRLLIG